jgi:hypothetical protein
MTTNDSFWDDVFHGCAWAAFIDEARRQRGAPDSESVRRRAFAYYEEELAIKNRRQPRQPATVMQDKTAADQEPVI